MKLKDTNDLKNKNIAELKSQLSDLQKQAVKASLDLKSRKNKNTNVVKNLKFKIAQILTFLTEKEN